MQENLSSLSSDSVSDTIAAISTAVSESGIGIIRVSGPEAITIGERVFRFPSKLDSGKEFEKEPGDIIGKETGKKPEKIDRLSDCPANTIHYGFIYDGDERVDEVLVSIFRAPRSYTAEDTVEINCHGGVFAMRRVLETVLSAGARPADPGEFTKRAFLNGRIDLTQAEAVMDVIQSQNSYALDNSLGLLRGSMKKEILSLRRELLHEMALIESALDDPEHYTLEGYHEKLEEKLRGWINKTEALLDSYHDGRILSEGVKTVILGRPNAGKSSLLNALMGEERAIVSQVPGTTRDTIDEKISLGNISLHIIDTAGIRTTEDMVENIGIDRAIMATESADLCLIVFDADEYPDEDDARILQMTKDKQRIFLLNKTDRPGKITVDDLRAFLNKETTDKDLSVDFEKTPLLEISALSGAGLDSLREMIKEIFYTGAITCNDQVVITSVRQRDELQKALASLQQVRQALEAHMPEDFLTIDLMDAYEHLGRIIGEQVGEDLINEIFERFCMGK